MTEHEVSRAVRASSADVFAVASDLTRLPEWLPTVEQARPAAGGTQVEVEGEAQGHDYESRGFWRPSADQLRVEWGSPSRDGQGGSYAGWLQVEDQGRDGTARSEVVAHLSFFDGDGPPDVEGGLTGALDLLAGLVEA